MIEILQGETLSFVLDGEDLTKYQVRAALRPSGTSFRRDCTCGNATLSWEHIDIVDDKAVWYLTSEQSASLPVGKYAMEIALRDIESREEIKDSTIEIINKKVVSKKKELPETIDLFAEEEEEEIVETPVETNQEDTGGYEQISIFDDEEE